MDQAFSRRTEEGLSIDLREMVWRLLEQWKAIVVFVIIIMLLFSGLMYVRGNSNTPSSSETPTAVQTQEEILKVLSPTDRSIVEAVFDMYGSRANLIDYVNNAPVMKLDSYNVSRLTMSWYIDADESMESELASAYREYLVSDEAIAEIQKVWGGDYTADQIKELVYSGNITNFYDDIDRESDVVKVRVFLPEGIDAASTEKSMTKIFSDANSALSAEVGAHNAVLLNSEVADVTDNDLGNFQTAVYTRLYTINYQINNMKALFSDNQKAVYEKLVALKNTQNVIPDVAPEQETKAKVSLFSKRNLAIGFILGCFIYGCIFLISFILSGKVQSTMPYERFYGIMTLGEWHSREGKKGLLNSLLTSKAVYRRHHKGHTDMDVEVDKTCKTIAAASEMNDFRKILLVSGKEADENVRAFTGELVKGLAEKGIESDGSTTDMKNGRSMEDEKLPKNDCALIVVDRNSICMKDIKDVLDKCAYFNTPLIGAVYVD
ncbi:MAG: hypothetical protein IJF96_03160 [Firmicutes bacterium]|nr:hypothetical protein [Bacillota bacterium]